MSVERSGLNVERSAPKGAVFLSYASQDADAAKRICDALRAAGVEVWFDQSELVGGDAWDQSIRKQISECALFIPVLSETTQARREAYFRLEWKLADERTHLMAEGTPFLLPVTIDQTTERGALVPKSFVAVQWTKLPGGETPAAFAARVKRLLGGAATEVGRGLPPSPSGPRSNDAAGLADSVLQRKRPWLVPTIIGVVAVTALALWQPWKKSVSPPAVSQPKGGPNPSEQPMASAPFSEARKLVEQARKVYDGGDELNRENLYLAEELVQRALTLDSAEPAAWELAAWLSYMSVWHSIDESPARRETLLRQANRAVALAPDGVAAQLVFANAQLVGRTGKSESAVAPGYYAEIQRSLLRLAEREPRNWKIQRALGTVYRNMNQTDEAIRSLQRALELSGEDPMASADLVNVLIRRQRYPDAEAILARALARHRSGRLLTFDVVVKCRWRGDTAGALKAIESWPAWLLRENRGVAVAWQAAYWGRQPARALSIVQEVTRDYLRDVNFAGPRAVLSARAHEIAGNTVAAQADWRLVVQRYDQDLAANSQDVVALFWKAWALARLGDTAGAQAAATLVRQQMQSVASNFFKLQTTATLWATVGWTDLALSDLRGLLEKPGDEVSLTRAYLELEPAFDPLRGDPRFQEILAAALAPPMASAPSIDHKSVAVLAFANLSDDKANEYFSDGISEELLNVLAKVPGLKVSARTSAFYFKGKEVPIPEIAQKLGVAYVVEGSVRKAGDKVRITAQLIKAADGFNVWSDTFTRDLKDIFAVQDEIAGLIAKNLELKMGINQVGARQAVSPEAYQEYLVGRAAAAKAGMADLREAVTHFERAVALEPKFTAAWVQLASAHTRLGRWGGAPTLQAWQAARAAIDRAKALEPDSPDVLLALGWILRTADWDWRGAEQAFRRTLQLQPNQPEALAGAAVLLFNIGQTEEAYRLGQQAVQLDPLNAAAYIDLSIMFYLNKNWAEAERSARRALQLAPGGASYHSILAWSLIAQQRYAEAEAEVALESDVIEQTTVYGLLAVARGQGQAARDRLARLEEFARINGDSADLQQSIAWLCAGLGEKDRAFAALERAVTSRDPSMSWLLNSWYLQPLFSDPRWPVLVRKVGLADDQLK